MTKLTVTDLFLKNGMVLQGIGERAELVTKINVKRMIASTDLLPLQTVSTQKKPIYIDLDAVEVMMVGVSYEIDQPEEEPIPDTPAPGIKGPFVVKDEGALEIQL